MGGVPWDSSDSPSLLVLGFGVLGIGDRACQFGGAKPSEKSRKFVIPPPDSPQTFVLF